MFTAIGVDVFLDVSKLCCVNAEFWCVDVVADDDEDDI